MSELLIGFGTGCSRTQRLILCRLSSRFTHLPKCTTISARSDTVGSFLALTVPLRIPSTAALPTLPHAVNCRVDGLPKSPLKIGRASCRERVCQYVSISVVPVELKKKKHTRK